MSDQHAPGRTAGGGILLYGMYDAGRQDNAPRVRIAMMASALAGRTHLESITGGRSGRFFAAVRWLAGRGPGRVRAVYVEAPTSNPMPTDLAFLALMRLLRKPVGIYFRDAYQLFREVHPRTRRRQLITDFLWRLTTPLLKRLATVRYAPSAGLASALRLSNPVLLPPGTDPRQPDLGIGEPDVVAAVVQLGPTSGLDTLVEAMRIVRRRRPNARLVVGSRAPEGFAAAGLPDWVEPVQANRASMADVLRPARVCVLPLPINAYTNLAVAVRLLEFLSFGKPTVATDTFESRNIVSAHGIGIATPDTAEGLAGGILRILEDEALARNLGAKARAYASGPDATWDARARTVLETLGLATTRTDAPLRIALLGDPKSVHTRRWATFFAERGHEMHVIAPDTDVATLTLPADPRWQLHTYRAWPRFGLSVAGMVGSFRSVRRVLRELDPDVLHSQAAGRYGFAAWLSRFRPYAVTVWGSDVLILPGSKRRRRLYTWLSLRGAQLVTGGSEHLVKAAIAAGARPAHTRYVHMGVDTARFAPGDGRAFRARIGLPRSGRVVLSARAIKPIYRQDVVVDAFARLPADTLLVMTRHLATDEEIAAITARASALGVGDRLRILPAVDEAQVPDLYRLADVVVSVPVSDGGPSTVVEALACGLPVVASDLPPNREWLAELDPQALVPVGDVAATAAALAAVLGRSPAERAERAERGRRAVCELADRELTMARMEVMYRDLAAERRGKA